MSNSKICNTCGQLKRLEEFRKFKRYERRVINCFECEKKLRQQWASNYQKKHRSRYVNYQNLSRARAAGCEVFDVTDKEIAKILSQRCVYCGSDKRISIDHAIPISRGGRHSIGNLVPACRACNMAKLNRTAVEWRYELIMMAFRIHKMNPKIWKTLQVLTSPHLAPTSPREQAKIPSDLAPTLPPYKGRGGRGGIESKK